MKAYLYIAAIFALLAALGSAVYYVDKNGAARVQARWDRAVAADLQTAHKAKDDADLQTPEITEEERAVDRAIVPRANPCVVPDPWDRDCRN